MPITDEERIALFIDFENLAIGAKERGDELDVKLIMDALSERGRVVVRRSYADWNLFSEHRQNLLSQRIEMIEVPQRTGMVRKNAADIKLAVDALELAFEREFVTTFVIASGDSDFTPLVLKLRELNKQVIGVGVEGSTSELLPGACDEFLFYGRLAGGDRPRRRRARSNGGTADGASDGASDSGGGENDMAELSRRITTTLAGLQRSINGPVLSSSIKRALLRKDPTFSEGDYGFRAWGELMRHLENVGVITLQESSAEGDPAVEYSADGSGEERAFQVLQDVVSQLQRKAGPPPLSGLKNEIRKRASGFSEKNYGFSGFLQFVKAAQARGLVEMEWNEESEDYYLSVAG